MISMIVWEVLSLFGNIWVWIILTLASIVFFFLLTGEKREYIVFFLKRILPSVFLARFFTEILKQVFRIERPCLGLNFCPSTYSFPSGHASVIFAAVTAIILKKKDKRLAAFLLIFASLVDLSRLMLNVHRIEDVIIGSFIGMISALSVEKVFQKWGSRDLNPGHRLPKPRS